MSTATRSAAPLATAPNVFRTAGSAAPARRVSPGMKSGSPKRVLSRRERLLVVTQISIMLKAGVDLAEAVRGVAERSASPRIRAAVGEVHIGLESGRLLSQALADQRAQFGGAMVASVAAGEVSGRLTEVLGRLASIMRDELRLHSAIRSAVSYPLVLMVVTLFVLAAMVFFVLPQFAGIYASSRAPTPPVTQLLLDGAGLARTYWWALAGGVSLLAFFAWRLMRSEAGRRRIDRQAFRLPLVKNVLAALMAGRMFRLQGAMLASGVPMLEVLNLTRDSVGSRSYRDLVDAIQESVVQGKGMAAVLSDSKIVPDGAAEMIATAEANGQLGGVLQTVGEFYESEGEQLLRDLVKIAEPAIIVVLGLVVGAIVLAVMLPLLDLSSAGAA